MTDIAPDATTEQAAQTAEATDGTLTVNYRDLTFTIPPTSKWDLDVIDYIEAGRVNKATALILGDEQYKAFRSTDPRPALEDLGTLYRAIQAAAGHLPGE